MPVCTTIQYSCVGINVARIGLNYSLKSVCHKYEYGFMKIHHWVTFTVKSASGMAEITQFQLFKKNLRLSDKGFI